MLDGLVCGAVFTKADGVVGEHEDGALLHQCCHAHGIAAVFHEDQEGGAVRHVATVQGDAVHDGGHAELAHTVVDVVAAGVLFRQALGATPDGEVGAGQVSGTTQQFRQQRTVGVQGVLGGLAAGDGFALVLTLLDVRLCLFREIGRQIAGHAALEFGRQFRLGLFVGSEFLFPRLLSRGAFLFGIPFGVDF